MQHQVSITLVTAQGLSLYKPAVPGYSRLSAFRPDAGLRGLISWRGQIIAWGENGIVGMGDVISPPFAALISAAATRSKRAK